MKRTSLTLLLPAVFVLSMLLLLATYAAFMLTDMRKALISQAVINMEAATARASQRVDRWFDSTAQTLTTVADSKHARDSIKQLSAILRAAGPEGPAFLKATYVDPNTARGMARDMFDYSGDRSAYGLTHGKVHEHYRALRRTHQFYDVFLFDAEGTLVYTVTKEADLGQNAIGGDLSRTSLGSAFRRAMAAETGTVLFDDFAPYSYSNGALASFMATPVLDDSGRNIGVVAIQLPSLLLADLVNDDGQTKQDYSFTLLGSGGYFWKKAGQTSIEGQSDVATPQVQAAKRGEVGVQQDAVNGEGTPVLATFRPVSAFNAGWAVLAEVTVAEVEAPVRQSQFRTLVALLLIVVAVLGVGLAISRWIAKPLAQLTLATTAMIERQPTSVGFQTRRDEVGELARGLERFRTDMAQADTLRVEMLFKGKAFATTSTAMMISDAKGTLLYVNSALISLFHTHLADLQTRFPGLDPDNLIGRNISVFHANHSSNMAMLSDPKNGKMETDIKIGDQVFALSISAVEGDDGARQGFVVVWEDVREQRRSNAVIAAVSSAQAILEIGLDGRILTMNDMALQVYQYDRPAIIGQHVGQLFKAGKAHAEDVLSRVVDQGHLSELHHRVARDGSDRFVICNLNVIFDRQGQAQRVVAICTDQTAETAFRTVTETSMKERAAEQQHVVESLRDALGALADGDLSTRIETTFPSEYESLRLNCNQAAQSLSDTLSRVAEVAGSILGGADIIATAAADLSRRTESQAATLEQTAAALDTLTSNVRSATEGTLKAGGKVKSAHGEARNNGAVVQQAIDAMTAIEQSSHQISKIISVIDDIAFQTNLLALNAGVEAARAGDAGRGFAVVAAEVRALAQRSSEAAKEIKTLISTSETQVGTGAGLVSQSGRAVEAIVTDVAEISVIVQNISQAAQDQSNSLAEINAGVAVLDKVTQQNAVMVEESTAASVLLKQEADELAALLSGFNLIGDAPRRGSSHAA
ncbi:MAG: methyl-accepting chemotaxis protein [Pseudotabrizicola sp.]|uniref:methyl-accepting chemotaxis protein n=1 Tax=Pseudotabrizicola sp. TaxID=2939647 RepID=UPI0027301882|nr:methyl-accepting chemotaxis protein [Pseudotabrizicola sp.]MDP2079451.1 methyl-accepting chemotaxis protein [Pseudotabrizicola sp.]MDZ7573641.1 methyl-accepting chemotaxis protein [Pseudotabrizicola sp.]